MNTLFNKYAPGFMCVPLKPHLFGNEYHSIADSDDNKQIMWCNQIPEGQNHPKLNSGRWAFPSKYANEMKTAGLMLFMTEPIHNTGCRWFLCCQWYNCLAQQGWLWSVPHQEARKVLTKACARHCLELEFLDNKLGVAKTYVQTTEVVKFLVHCHKDDKCVCKIMSMHSLMTPIEDHTTYWYV
ncbi:LOW QUALITY PROTEIN: hypothetical protein ACHAW6_001451 [Cyclotella cf. meneghiniana]